MDNQKYQPDNNALQALREAAKKNLTEGVYDAYYQDALRKYGISETEDIPYEIVEPKLIEDKKTATP